VDGGKLFGFSTSAVEAVFEDNNIVELAVNGFDEAALS
jgi:hypothetical protein